jgi:MFS family permease
VPYVAQNIAAMNEPPTMSARRGILGTRSHRVSVALYILIAFLYWSALYLYVPTLPTYVQGRSENLALVGMILAQYGLWQAVVRLPLGVAADWLGRRKPFIVLGILLSGVGAWVMGTADGAAGLAIGRAVTGLAASTWVPMTVAFSGLYPPQEAIRATAILTFVSSIGRMAATSVSGSLNGLGGYSLPFFLAAGVAALAALLMLSVPERMHAPQRPSLGKTGRLITRRDVLIPAMLAAVSQYANWGITFGFMPILAGQLGATHMAQSLLVSMHIAVVTVLTLAAAPVVNRIGTGWLVITTFALMAGAIGLAALAPTLAIVFVAQFCLGAAQGLSYALLMGMSIQNVADAERTTAMGLHQAVYAVGMFAGPWLCGSLAEALGLRPMFGVTAFVCLAAGLLLIRLLPRKQAAGRGE